MKKISERIFYKKQSRISGGHHLFTGKTLCHDSRVLKGEIGRQWTS